MLSALLLVCAAAGCVLMTGTTDGYEALPAPARPSDAGGSLVLGCLAASDCDDGDGGDGADRGCCVVLASTSAAVAACQPLPCGGTLPIQLCREDAECNGAGCREQRCVIGSTAVTLRACGAIPSCTPS